MPSDSGSSPDILNKSVEFRSSFVGSHQIRMKHDGNDHLTEAVSFSLSYIRAGRACSYASVLSILHKVLKYACTCTFCMSRLKRDGRRVKLCQEKILFTAFVFYQSCTVSCVVLHLSHYVHIVLRTCVHVFCNLLTSIRHVLNVKRVFFAYWSIPYMPMHLQAY